PRHKRRQPFYSGQEMDKSAQFLGALCAGMIARWLLFSGERTRPRVPISAPRRNASLVQPKKVVGEAPTTHARARALPRPQPQRTRPTHWFEVEDFAKHIRRRED